MKTVFFFSWKLLHIPNIYFFKLLLFSFIITITFFSFPKVYVVSRYKNLVISFSSFPSFYLSPTESQVFYGKQEQVTMSLHKCQFFTKKMDSLWGWINKFVDWYILAEFQYKMFFVKCSISVIDIYQCDRYLLPN